MEHKVQADVVCHMALSGDMIVIADENIVRVFNIFSCLFVCPKCVYFTEVRYS